MAVRNLVENALRYATHEVRVLTSNGGGHAELSVSDDDYGAVIGRGGRTAAALRTLVKTAGTKRKRRGKPP